MPLAVTFISWLISFICWDLNMHTHTGQQGRHTQKAEGMMGKMVPCVFGRNDCVSHFRCSCGIVVVIVEVVLVRVCLDRQQDVYIQIIVWFLCTCPVISWTGVNLSPVDLKKTAAQWMVCKCTVSRLTERSVTWVDPKPPPTDCCLLNHLTTRSAFSKFLREAKKRVEICVTILF